MDYSITAVESVASVSATVINYLISNKLFKKIFGPNLINEYIDNNELYFKNEKGVVIGAKLRVTLSAGTAKLNKISI